MASPCSGTSNNTEEQQQLQLQRFDPYRDDEDHQLYENENEEKERQYQQHKQMLAERRKYGLAPLSSAASAALRVTPFCCTKCNKGFNKRKQYEKHLKTHEPKSQCRYCDFSSRNKKHFEAHELRHMKENPQFECDLCQAKYATSSLLRGHRGRIHCIFHCFHCSFAASSFEERNRHMIEVHRAKPNKRKRGMYNTEPIDDDEPDTTEVEPEHPEHICDICDKQCRSRALLKIHVAQHMNIDPSQLTDDLELNENTIGDTTGDLSEEDSEGDKIEYTPPRAPASRKRSMDAAQEDDQAPPAKIPLMALNHNAQARYINDPEVNLLARIRPACENATYYCAKCSLSLHSPHELFMHVVTQHSFMEYDARRRLQSRHVNPKQSVSTNISYTGTVFAPTMRVPATTKGGTATSLLPRRRAAPLTRYTCKVCGATMRKSKQLTKHLRTHSQWKKCDQCNFSSKQYMKVVSHQCAMHKDMVRCPYLCLRLFKTREEMIVHRDAEHGDKRKDAEDEGQEKDEDDAAALPGDTKKTCELCGRELSATNMARHMRTCVARV